MDKNDKVVGDVLNKILVIGGTGNSIAKELFNEHVIKAASINNDKVITSDDGYAMVEINGKAEVVIPMSIMGLEGCEIPYGGVIIKTEPHPLNELMKELSESIICKMDDIDEKFTNDYQPWKKSHQDHPAFKRRR